MTIVTLRPTSTIVVSMTEVGGSAHAVLADDNDATYTEAAAPGHNVYVQMTDPSLPAGAVARYVTVRVRQGSSLGIQHVVELRDASGTVLLQQAFNGQGSIATFSTFPFIRPFTATELNGLQWGDFVTDAGARVYAAYIDVVYVVVPTVSVVSPTGTITDTNRPTVVWSRSLDEDGGGQIYYELRVFTAAQYSIGGFDPATSPATYASGQVASRATSARVGATLADGAYRSYVRIAQSVNGTPHWSAWDNEPFTLDVLRPGVPTMALTAQSSAGRIKIDLSDNAGETTTDGFELERSVDGGVNWVAVRTEGDELGRVLGTAATVYDYEAPNGTTTAYRARALHDYSGSFAESAWSASSSTAWSSRQEWLKHPNRPALNLPVEIFSYPDANRAARQGLPQPLGAALPVPISDTRGGATGTIVLQCYSLAEQTALDALLDLTATLLLQCPADAEKPDRYVRIGDQASVRVVDKSFVAVTHETLAWVLVATPLGAQTGEQYEPAEDDGEALVIA